MNENTSGSLILVAFFCLSAALLSGRTSDVQLKLAEVAVGYHSESMFCVNGNGLAPRSIFAASLIMFGRSSNWLRGENSNVGKNTMNLNVLLWLLLGLLSVAGLIIVKIILVSPLGIAWLIFLTIATGIGFLLSEKIASKEKLRFPKSFFIASIAFNCVTILLHFIKID